MAYITKIHPSAHHHNPEASTLHPPAMLPNGLPTLGRLEHPLPAWLWHQEASVHSHSGPAQLSKWYKYALWYIPHTLKTAEVV